MTFLFDWTLRLGLIAIRKWQSKSFRILKEMSDIAWDKKWKQVGYNTDPKTEKRVKFTNAKN